MQIKIVEWYYNDTKKIFDRTFKIYDNNGFYITNECNKTLENVINEYLKMGNITIFQEVEKMYV